MYNQHRREACVPSLPFIPDGDLGMSMGRERVRCAFLGDILVQGKMVAGSTIAQLG